MAYSCKLMMSLTVRSINWFLKNTNSIDLSYHKSLTILINSTQAFLLSAWKANSFSYKLFSICGVNCVVFKKLYKNIKFYDIEVHIIKKVDFQSKTYFLNSL